MGIFDRGGKKGQDKQQVGSAPADDDYFDSPQESISLNAPTAPAQKGQPVGPASVVVAQQDEPERPHYTIGQAIELMRALPVDQNVELVVAVIKTTLESLKVKVADIIEDATRKQKDLEQRVANLKQQIAEFEREIQTRKDEITRLEADHAETSDVKAKLELAERAQKAAPAQKSALKPATPAAAGGKA